MININFINKDKLNSITIVNETPLDKKYGYVKQDLIVERITFTPLIGKEETITLHYSPENKLERPKINFFRRIFGRLEIRKTNFKPGWYYIWEKGQYGWEIEVNNEGDGDKFVRDGVIYFSARIIFKFEVDRPNEIFFKQEDKEKIIKNLKEQLEDNFLVFE